MPDPVLSPEEFNKLPMKEQNTVMYRTIVAFSKEYREAMIEISQLRNEITDLRTENKHRDARIAMYVGAGSVVVGFFFWAVTWLIGKVAG